jgi:hypothetical protein
MTETASPFFSFAICLFGSMLMLYARAKTKAQPVSQAKH